ncbi:MAG TPA: NrfD/PsrC family molybdoenzyme membrane anchor subunit [Stellaceae bacterium]|nr:NrfD/PsrC family molybdoenzyme membrane anchor subunit [Stellaceae bacterium]
MASEVGHLPLSRTAGEGASRRSLEAGEGIAARTPSPTARIRERSPLSRNAGEGQAIPTYYDQPALKPSPYGWKVSAYMFVSGIAGAAQILAAAAELTDRDKYAAIIRNGRYVAFAGAAIGAPLLIADLHTPQRFYNMLRIFRPTSPMSIGTYVLTGFGLLSGVLAVLQAARADRAARIVQLPAAAAGAALSTYTGALLTATSTPLWAAAPRLIPALFGASAMSGAATLLSLGADGATMRPLSRIGAAAGAVECGLLLALPSRLAAAGIRTSCAAAPLLAAAAVPLLAQAARRRAPPDRRASTVLAAAAIAGTFLVRHLLLQVGNRSAARPRNYFRFARPR